MTAPLTGKGLPTFSLLAALALFAPAQAQDDGRSPHAGMLRYPDVSETHIVFSYANDLWTVPRRGGMATPLASPPGQELFPRFSADGSTIAFQGNYEGNRDLYTIPSAGGIPERITHHPSSETLCDWTPDGRLLFYSNGHSAFPKWQRLLTVDARGGLPEPLPLPYGAVGAIHPNGQFLAYTPYNRDSRTWKRYRGGMASDLWLFDLNDRSARKITSWEGTDSQPMWHGDVLYYVSDAGPEHRLNLWKWERRGGNREQITNFSDNDVKWPAIGPGPRGDGEIVFQLGSELRLLDLGTGRSKVVEVQVPGDRSKLRPRTVDMSDHIQAWDLSPSAKRAVVSARGDIWTLPAKNGAPRNLTRTNGVAERSPTWSPDGRWIAYFTDETGEYELAITQSDGKGETKRLTDLGGPFKEGLRWSPDSKHLLIRDKGNRLFLHTVDGETKQIDEDPWGSFFGGYSLPSWSHDSRWITWSRGSDVAPISVVFIHELETGETRQVTSGMFGDSSPVFDRKGDWLYFSSDRNFSPTYSTIDTTFIYRDSSVLLAVPLRSDLGLPWAPESDEETWDDEEEEEESEEEGDEEGDEEDEGEQEPADEGADDGISGTWEGTLTGDEIPPGGVPMTVEVWMEADGTIKGFVSVPMGSAEIIDGSFDRDSGKFLATIETEDGEVAELTGTVTGDQLEATGSLPSLGLTFSCSLTRTEKLFGGEAQEKAEKKKDGEAREVVEIEFDGFEARAVLLPLNPGSFGRLAVNDKNQLLFARFSGGGSIGGAAIKLFDIEDEDQEEKTVASGAGGFAITADGAHILIARGGGASIQKASSGGKAEPVPTGGMEFRVDPREEWRQLFLDAWRIERDYFYAANMHGVDWEGVRDHYLAMIEDCTSRADVNFVLGEMISEMNVGHAYLTGGGDGESQPRESVGMLGADFTLENGAYRIATIFTGAAWDTDARGPLNQPGIDVSEGDYLLAVNGMPVDTTQDPWAAFQGLAGRVTTLTVSANPSIDEEAREVVVEPTGGEFNLRYRHWIETNRAYVEERTGGRVGYVYVPDTGINGQNNLFRQFTGQIHKGAVIVDERWNGGGQIPTRFIELLNRPVTNYWAGREGRDWHWPPDSHQGPKCMLINGLSGSGGDAFPAYFKQAGLGKLIGTRTWGGLVGISGNPSLIDGGSVSAPTFAYYETDGTWGIEGHGVDPDIEIVDHPAELTKGVDPQLEAAIDHMLAELESNPYVKPARPAYPDRSGMGLAPDDH